MRRQEKYCKKKTEMFFINWLKVSENTIIRVPTLLLTKKSRTFPDFPGPP